MILCRIVKIRQNSYKYQFFLALFTRRNISKNYLITAQIFQCIFKGSGKIREKYWIVKFS